MDYLQWVSGSFPHRSIQRCAIRTNFVLPAFKRDLLANLCPLEVVYCGPSNASNIQTSLIFAEEDFRAILADAVQKLYYESQVPDVKCWERQLDLTEVTIASLELLPASGTLVLC